jgi:hypothetical protein
MKAMDQRQGPFDLYRYQQRMLPGLLGWAAGSMAAGMFLWLKKNSFLKGVGAQFLAGLNRRADCFIWYARRSRQCRQIPARRAGTGRDGPANQDI